MKHDRCTMKVGTDAVLLGAWVSVEGVSRALDVGTGSGVIALILAQRTNGFAHIDGIEIRDPDAQQARENVAASPWPDCITIHHERVQNFAASHAYDLIVCNPPFFSNGPLPPSTARQQVRHTQTLTAADLLTAAGRLLLPTGRLAIVLPTLEAEVWGRQALNTGWYLLRRLAFFSRPGKPQERWLMEWSRTGAPTQTETLCLYEGEGSAWSGAYRALTKSLYLAG